MNIGEMIEKIYSVTYGDAPGKFTVAESYFGYNGSTSSSHSSTQTFNLTGSEGLIIIAEAKSTHELSVDSGSCNLTKLCEFTQAGNGSTGAAAVLQVYQYKNNKSAVIKHSGPYGNSGTIVGVCITY